MKKLSINPNLFNIDITDPKFVTLVIESKPFYWKFSRYLYDDFPDHLNYCSLMHNGSEVKMDEVGLYISNLLDLSLNSKPNLNALYKILKKTYFQELSVGVEEIQSQLTKICKEIRLDFDAELTMDGSIKIDDIFKIGGLQFLETEEDGLLEQLSRYVCVTRELRNVSIVFVNHLHDYLEDNNIESFIKEIQYKGITLINLETTKPLSKTETEEILIIDNDFCTIQ